MAELVSTVISSSDPAPQAPESPEVKSKPRRKSSGRLNAKQRLKQVADKVKETSTAIPSTDTNATTSTSIAAAASLTATNYEKDPVFLVMASGQIESAEIPDFDELYCNYTMVYGTDWSIISGLAEGITQTTRRSGGVHKNFVWNFPIEITFKSTNPYGWPQIVLSIYGLNSLERDEVRGYGVIHFPIIPGSHTLEVPLFVPKSSSEILNFLSWLAGRKPEFLDPRFIAQGRGREVTRTASQGHVTVKLNIVTKDLWEHGYRNGSHHGSKTQSSS